MFPFSCIWYVARNRADIFRIFDFFWDTFNAPKIFEECSNIVDISTTMEHSCIQQIKNKFRSEKYIPVIM